VGREMEFKKKASMKRSSLWVLSIYIFSQEFFQLRKVSSHLLGVNTFCCMFVRRRKAMGKISSGAGHPNTDH
jgi:hypothetical protein